MKEKINKLIIATDGFPLEQFIGRPITNFFRRLLLGKEIVCKECYNHKSAQKNPNFDTQQKSPCP